MSADVILSTIFIVDSPIILGKGLEKQSKYELNFIIPCISTVYICAINILII